MRINARYLVFWYILDETAFILRVRGCRQCKSFLSRSSFKEFPAGNTYTPASILIIYL